MEKFLLEVAGKVYYFHYLFMEVKIGDPGPKILDMVQEDEDDDIFEGEESRLLIPDNFSERSPSESSSAIPTIDANGEEMFMNLPFSIVITLSTMERGKILSSDAHVRRHHSEDQHHPPRHDRILEKEEAANQIDSTSGRFLGTN